MEHAIPMACGITAAIEVEGASHIRPDLLGHLLQGFEPLRYRIMSVSWTGAPGVGARGVPVEMEQKTSIRRMAWSLFHVHARRALLRDASCCSFHAARRGRRPCAARPHPWGRRISHMGSRIRTAPARCAKSSSCTAIWLGKSWPSCPTGASAPPYGAPTTNGRLHWGCHVPHRQEASDELASRRRERGTVSAEPLTLRTMAPLRTCQPRSSLSALRRFHQGFTDVQLVADFSWHRFQVGLPAVFLRLRPA